MESQISELVSEDDYKEDEYQEKEYNHLDAMAIVKVEHIDELLSEEEERLEEEERMTSLREGWVSPPTDIEELCDLEERMILRIEDDRESDEKDYSPSPRSTTNDAIPDQMHEDNEDRSRKPYEGDAEAKATEGFSSAEQNGFKEISKKNADASSKLSCPLCNRKISTQWNLDQHLSRHTGIRPFKCKHCPKKFTLLIYLKKHTKLAHKVGIEKHKKILNAEGKMLRNTTDRQTTEVQPLTGGEITSLEMSCDDKKKLTSKHNLHPGLGAVQCNVCNRRISTIWNLELHLNRHKGIRVFPCKLCSMKFNQRFFLKKHMLHTHRISMQKTKIRPHAVEKDISEEAISGNSFDEQLPEDRESVYVERSSDINKKQPTAKHCSSKRTREDPVRCNVCGKLLHSKGYLNQHMNVHTRNKVFSCSQCDSKFLWRHNYKLHIRKHHKELLSKDNVTFKEEAKKNANARNETQKQQNISPERLSLKRNLNVHLSTPIEGKSIVGIKSDNNQKQCQDSSALAKSSERETIPRKSETREVEAGDAILTQIAQQYQCLMCPKKASSKAAVLAHMQTHMGGKPGECSICKRKVDNLARHMLLHTGEKFYECLICGKKFSRSDYYRFHMKKAHNRKVTSQPAAMKKPTFACIDCKKDFDDKNALQNHRMKCPNSIPVDTCSLSVVKDSENTKNFSSDQSISHSQEDSNSGRIKCQMCRKTFCSEWYLKRHMSSHTGTVPLRCKFCSKGFRYRISLRKHLQTHKTNDKEEQVQEATEGAKMEIAGDKVLDREKEKVIETDCNSLGQEAVNYGDKVLDRNKEKVIDSTSLSQEAVNYDCTVCGKVMKSILELLIHKESHDEIKKSQFSTIDETLSKSQDIARRTQKHSHLKPFGCLVCGKKFSKERKFKTHMTMHSNENNVNKTHHENTAEENVNEEILIGSKNIQVKEIQTSVNSRQSPELEKGKSKVVSVSMAKLKKYPTRGNGELKCNITDRITRIKVTRQPRDDSSSVENMMTHETNTTDLKGYVQEHHNKTKERQSFDSEAKMQILSPAIDLSKQELSFPNMTLSRNQDEKMLIEKEKSKTQNSSTYEIIDLADSSSEDETNHGQLSAQCELQKGLRLSSPGSTVSCSSTSKVNSQPVMETDSLTNISHSDNEVLEKQVVKEDKCESIHMNKASVKCNLCGRVFSRLKLQRHLMNQTCKGLLECSECKEKHYYKEHLEKHMLSHLKKSPSQRCAKEESGYSLVQADPQVPEVVEAQTLTTVPAVLPVRMAPELLMATKVQSLPVASALRTELVTISEEPEVIIINSRSPSPVDFLHPSPVSEVHQNPLSRTGTQPSFFNGVDVNTTSINKKSVIVSNKQDISNCPQTKSDGSIQHSKASQESKPRIAVRKRGIMIQGGSDVQQSFRKEFEDKNTLPENIPDNSDSWNSEDIVSRESLGIVSRESEPQIEQQKRQDWSVLQSIPTPPSSVIQTCESAGIGAISSKDLYLGGWMETSTILSARNETAVPLVSNIHQKQVPFRTDPRPGVTRIHAAMQGQSSVGEYNTSEDFINSTAYPVPHDSGVMLLHDNGPPLIDFYARPPPLYHDYMGELCQYRTIRSSNSAIMTDMPPPYPGNARNNYKNYSKYLPPYNSTHFTQFGSASRGAQEAQIFQNTYCVPNQQYTQHPSIQ